MQEIGKKSQVNMDRKSINLGRYDPSLVEREMREFWDRTGCLKSEINRNNEDHYCVVIPPPNANGELHMGHALQQSTIDMIIRYKRMSMFNVLCLMGTDHAGIATQVLMERRTLAEEGKSRHDYGREVFVDKIWKWTENNRKLIREQMGRIGSCADFSSERFTLDDDFSKTVRSVFLTLHRESLVYRSKRIVNWDSKIGTVISDLEVRHAESDISMWDIKYYLSGGAENRTDRDHLVVSTTRPETLLADTAVAVHPEDSRYKSMVGRSLILPIVGRSIPIISDNQVDMEKGTGAVKLTPAHDFNDYEIGKRHRLPMINLFTADGRMRNQAEVFNCPAEMAERLRYIPSRFENLDKFSAREKILSELERSKLLVGSRKLRSSVPYSERSGTVVEPMITDQWYIKTQPLAALALSAVNSGEIKFLQKEYENMYLSWMNDIQDWCVSRQLWWGHRIPVWYDREGNSYAGYSEQEIRSSWNVGCDVELRQDEDVLDTWFSSALWVFATLGWGKKEQSWMKFFHPVDLVISGFDIVFFWIARMIMLTTYLARGERTESKIPFRSIYITGLVRDDEGLKMSKSRGNVIDPLDVMDGISVEDLIGKQTSGICHGEDLPEKITSTVKKKFPCGIRAYGADSLRLMFLSTNSGNRNIRWDVSKLEDCSNFCNKLWNACRFVISKMETEDHRSAKMSSLLPDRWIISELNKTVRIFHESMDKHRLDMATINLRRFVWDKFCSKYLEAVKIIMTGRIAEEVDNTKRTMVSVMRTALRLLHPIIPFVTEAMWQKIADVTGHIGERESIITQPFPKFNPEIDDSSGTDFELISRMISSIRAAKLNLRSNRAEIEEMILTTRTAKLTDLIDGNTYLIRGLTGIENVKIVRGSDGFRSGAVNWLVDDVELSLLTRSKL